MPSIADRFSVASRFLSAFGSRAGSRRSAPWSFALLGLSLATRFYRYGTPRLPVIDEVYFAQYLSGYLNGAFTFDLHPPLGRLLVALVGKLAGMPPVPQTMAWNVAFPDDQQQVLRLLPCLVGSGLPLIVYGIAARLTDNQRLAFVIGCCAALDNALITQSRFLFFDVFLLAFGFGSVLTFLHFQRTRRWPWLVLTGLLAGASASVKWTGLTFVALPIVLSYVELIALRARFRDVVRVAATTLAGAAAAYGTTFAFHLGLLTDSGPGDGFVSPAFQKTLSGSRFALDPAVTAATPLEKFWELQRVMLEVSGRVADHPFGSRWYEWPLNHKGLGYYQQDGQEIVLIGNDVVWWLGSAAMLWLVGSVLVNPHRLAIRGIALITLGYAFNWLPFIAITRVMFLHHYLSALIFSLLGVGWLLQQNTRLLRMPELLLVPVCIGYALRATITYGW